MNFDKLPINWFDFVVVIMILLGANKGRKHGMSEELMVSLQWAAIVFACAFLYHPLGDMLAQSSPLSHLFCYLVMYITTAIVVKIIFSLIKKGAGGKLAGSSVFGRGEFYLGMVAGGFRFLCILLAACALLNARSYTNQEVSKAVAFQNDVYGSTFFPELYSVQAEVFKESFSGKQLKEYASFLLIKPTAPEYKSLQRKESLP
ncbi:MAG: Colicin production protein [Pedosphaera sp.]|nr:Colicin production protein [Pedosphaera sp.]